MGILDLAGAVKNDAAESREVGSGRQRFAAGTPEDVAALYTWANIQGARYRDFSGSRVRHREKVRARAAELLRERARAGAEGELVEAARAAFVESEGWLLEEAMEALDPPEGQAGPQTQVQRESVSRGVPVVRLTEAPEMGSRSGRSFQEELNSQLRRGGGQDSRVWHAEESGESGPSSRASSVPTRGTSEAEELRRDLPKDREDSGRSREAQVRRSGFVPTMPERESREKTAARVGESRSVPAARRLPELRISDRWERVEDEWPGPAAGRGSVAPLALDHEEPAKRPSSASVRAWEQAGGGKFEHHEEEMREYAGPAWLYGEGSGRPSRPAAAHAQTPEVRNDDPGERERWSTLRSVDEGRSDVRAAEGGAARERRPPLTVLFSLAGGVGKTSVVATLGRVLSASGERVALGDAAACSLLPFYFGARDVRPGAKRMFAPPEGLEDAPIFVANYDLARRAGDATEQRQLVAEILRNGSECNRILLDLPADSEWLMRRLVTLGSTVVVPLLPDMNSVIGLDGIERHFERMADAEGSATQPFYLLNQFDGSLALHLEVREVLRRRLGERLLSFVVRRSPVVSEALAEGMTVVDYAPESPVSRDYFDLAAWLRTVSPPALAGMRSLRSGAR